MAKVRPGIVVGTSEAQEMLGYLIGVEEVISSSAYKRNVAKSVHGYYAEQFDEQFSMTARAAPGSYHHMFENRMVGLNNKQAKLWRHTLRGQGSGAQASWNFLPAKTPILNPRERRSKKVSWYDPIKDVSVKDWRSFLRHTRGLDYYFPDKALHQEYNIVQRISIVNARALWIPLPGGEIKYRTDWDYTNENSGYDTTGKFTAYWTAFWGQQVPATFGATLGTHIEKELAKQIELGVRPRKRARAYGFSVIANEAAAFEAGRQRAKAVIWYGVESLRGVSEGADYYDGII